jgi:hypothetical protein
MANAQALVLGRLVDSNKPDSAQGITAWMQAHKIPKGQVEKALASLTEQGKIIEKPFGKSKIYFRSQEGLSTLEPQVHDCTICSVPYYGRSQFSRRPKPSTFLQEVAAQMAQIKELSEQCLAQEETIAALKKGKPLSHSSVLPALVVCSPSPDAFFVPPV